MLNIALTMRKHAPIITAFILTSRSIGNWIPKLSESVNISRRSPVHCLLIFPILLTSSMVRIWGRERSDKDQSLNLFISLEGEHVFFSYARCHSDHSKSALWIMAQLAPPLVEGLYHWPKSLSQLSVIKAAEPGNNGQTVPHRSVPPPLPVQATVHFDWKHISCLRAQGASSTKKQNTPRGRECYRVMLCFHQFNGFLVFGETHLKVNIWEAAPSTEGPMDLQHRLAVFVRNQEFRGERMPLLYNVPQCVTGGGLHLQLSEGLWENTVWLVGVNCFKNTCKFEAWTISWTSTAANSERRGFHSPPANSRGSSRTCTSAAGWRWWPPVRNCRARGWWRSAWGRSTVDSGSRSPPRRRTRSDPWRYGPHTCCCSRNRRGLREGEGHERRR